MTEPTPDRPSTVPTAGSGTDIDAAELDLEAGAGDDVPATSDPEQLVDDETLGGTGAGGAGGAG